MNKKLSVLNLISIIINILSTIVTGLAVSLGWNVFVLRVFDLPEMSVVTAIGILFLIELVRVNISRDLYFSLKTNQLFDDERIEGSDIIIALTGLVFALTSWLGIFIVTLF